MSGFEVEDGEGERPSNPVTAHRNGSPACRPLWAGFVATAERVPDRPALLADGQTLTYAELADLARRIGATIQTRSDPAGPPLTAVFAYRTPAAFAGVLGSLLAGHGYVPLNRNFPTARTRIMFEQAGCRSLIVDRDSLVQLDELLAETSAPLLVLAPDLDDVADLRAAWPAHTILGAADLASAATWTQPETQPDAVAYLLFTSGSTGIPKGVMVAHRNVTAFLDYVLERYQITEHDRLSQMFDMTFDLSVFDMFVAWERGAWLCCPPKKALMNPTSFIKEMELTVWFSVPSAAVLIKRLRALRRGAFPSLRLSLFCGEPLPLSVAAAWDEAAPNSVVENIYGPTELTIACRYYRWDAVRSPTESEIGIVPIGEPFPGMRTLIVNQQLNEVAPGQHGELLMAGPQMTLGYWKDPDKTAAAFITPPGHSEIYYRTGDRVRRPMPGAPMTHLGRMDSQIKLRGYRVELGEIESAVRDACGRDGVVAVPWPVTENGYEGIEVFVEAEPLDVVALRADIASRLPDYMVPRRFHFLDRLPLNVNGKFDRKALAACLASEASAEPPTEGAQDRHGPG
jgi:amino acid adenylation domain-containing protein